MGWPRDQCWLVISVAMFGGLAQGSVLASDQYNSVWWAGPGISVGYMDNFCPPWARKALSLYWNVGMNTEQLELE